MTEDGKKPIALKRVSRRKAVKQIVGGVSALAAYNMLPVRWEKPIIEQIFLPVHAAVSGITLSDPCTVELVRGNQESSIDVVRVSGFVSPPVGGLAVTIVATPNGGSGGPVTVTTSTASAGTYSAEITMVGGPGIIGVGATSTVAGVSGAAHCSVGIPPADHPSAQQPQQPAPTVTLTFVGNRPCGSDLPLNSDGGLSNSQRVLVTPSPTTNTTLTFQFFVERAGTVVASSPPTAAPVTVFTSGFTSNFSGNFGIGSAQVGDILIVRVPYEPTGDTAECSNPVVAAPTT